MADDAQVDLELARAIPALSVRTAEQRTEGVASASQERLWPIVVRAFPYLNRYIAGRWRHFGAPLPAETAPAGLTFMPVLVTALMALWMFGGLMAPASAAPTRPQLGIIFITWVLGLLTTALSWLCLALRGRARTVGAVVLIVFALLMGAATAIAPLTLGGKAVGAGIVLAVISGWAFRVRLVRDRGVSIRIDSHVIYYYMLAFVSISAGLVSSLFTVDMLYTGILTGRPLTPGLAHLLGHPEFGVGPQLTRAMRHTLQWQYLWVTLAIYLALGVPFVVTLPYYATWIHQRVNQDLRVELLARWTQLSPRYHTQHRVGDSIYRLIQDSSGIVNILNRLYLAAAALSGIGMALFLICFFDWRIALFGLGMVVVMTVFARLYSPRLRVRAIAAREATSDLTSSVEEIMTGVRVTKAYRQEGREQARFQRDSVTAFDAAFRVRWLFTSVGVISFVMMGAFLIPSEVLTALWASAGRPVAAGALVAMIGLSYTRWNLAAQQWITGQLTSLAQSVRGVNSEWAAAQDNTMALRRVFEILETEPEIADPPAPKPITGFTREIRFEDVSFAYEPDRPVLKSVSLTTAPGSVTAIVGPTGSGKSTLMALLLRVFDPDEGRITLDGTDLRDFAVEDLRAQIAVAPQEPILFAQSVLENVRYAAPHVGLAEVEAACRIACADDFIADMPQGYDTLLGDRGSGLSPGQRQRLCIARALVRGAPILILDEPTAPLDAETEHRVMANLAVWGQGRAIFVITHRLSTVRRADHILFLEDGALTERGSHAELMARPGGRYRAMVDAELALAERGAVA